MSKLISVLLTAILISACGVVAPFAAEESVSGLAGEAYHNQTGMAHFEKGFSELTPQHKKQEAEQEFELAIEEFQKALTINQAFSEAHKNLARLYYVQKKFLKAATHYEKVTELNPNDIDSYVLASLSYAQAQRFAKARELLESAKSVAPDPQVVNKLNEYHKKLDQAEIESLAKSKGE
jgi:tetratricopeptide (TPR) repeat protein